MPAIREVILGVRTSAQVLKPCQEYSADHNTVLQPTATAPAVNSLRSSGYIALLSVKFCKMVHSNLTEMQFRPPAGPDQCTNNPSACQCIARS